VVVVAEDLFALGEFEVGFDHHSGELFEFDLGLPIEEFFGLGAVAEEEVDFGGAEIAGVGFDVFFPVEAEEGEAFFDPLADGVGFAGGDDEVLGFFLLEHEVHGFDVITCEAPVAFGVEVAHEEFVLQAELDAGGGAGDFAGDEGFAAARGFVVKEDAVDGEGTVGLAVVDDLPVGVDLGAGVGGAGVEGGGFLLGGFDDLAEHFGAGGLVELDRVAGGFFEVADGFEEHDGAEGIGLDGVDGHVEGDADVGLSAEVVDFGGLALGKDLAEAGAVGEVTVVQSQARVRGVGILVDVVDAFGVEGGGAADDAVDFITFGEEEFGEVGAILAGDAGDEGAFVVTLHVNSPGNGISGH